MKAVRSLRLPPALEEELHHDFASRGIREWSAGVVALLTEGVRMRRVPGIIFVDSIGGRRAAVAATGLDVWEIIATWKTLGENEGDLQSAYDWVSPAQLAAALAYYRLYPHEIDERISLEARWSPEEIRASAPAASIPAVRTERVTPTRRRNVREKGKGKRESK